MRKLLHFYLASSFVLPFVVSTIFFVTFLLTFELFKLTKLIISQDVSFLFVAGLVGDIAVTLLPMAIPISIFFSVIFCMGKMSSDSEYIAMRSFGMNKMAILKPFLIIGTFIAINAYFLGQELVPVAHKDMRQKVIMLSSESLIAGLKSGQFFTAIDGVTLFPAYVSEDGKDLSEIYINIFDKEKSSERFIFAKEGNLIYDKNSKTGIESLNLHLRKGNIVDVQKEVDRVEKILFDDYIFPMTSKRFSYNFRTRETMMSFSELKKFITDGFESAQKNGYSKKDFFNAKYEFWNRMNTPLVCILFTILGFCLGVKGTRGSNKNSAGTAILYLVGYYLLFFAGVSLARDNNISIPLTLSLPLIVLSILTVRLYKKLDWQS